MHLQHGHSHLANKWQVTFDLIKSRPQPSRKHLTAYPRYSISVTSSTIRILRGTSRQKLNWMSHKYHDERSQKLGILSCVLYPVSLPDSHKVFPQHNHILPISGRIQLQNTCPTLKTNHPLDCFPCHHPQQ